MARRNSAGMSTGEWVGLAVGLALAALAAYMWWPSEEVAP
jgi:hypothetical protein